MKTLFLVAVAWLGLLGLSPALAAEQITTTLPHDTAIVAGGTAQQIMPTNQNRKSFYVFNPDASEPLWCSLTTTSPVANTKGSFAIAPTSTGSGGFGMEANANIAALWCVAATTGHQITAWESQ